MSCINPFARFGVQGQRGSEASQNILRSDAMFIDDVILVTEVICVHLMMTKVAHKNVIDVPFPTIYDKN